MPKIKKKLTKEDAEKQEATQEVKEIEEKEVKEEVKEMEKKKTAKIKKETRGMEKKKTAIDAWKPKSRLGKKVKAGEITDIDEIIDRGLKILEPGIVDILIPDLNVDLLLIGQSKGKFGGGQKRIFRQTQKKTREGNKPHFATAAVAGNGNGYVGIGYGKSRETVPAREKAMRNAKLNIIKVKRGCGSWQCGCKEPHTIPYQVRGKCGSSIIKLIPAPKGTGLAVEKECAKILKAAGIKDIWSKTLGQSKTKINLIAACIEALKELTVVKIRAEDIENLGIVEGRIKKKDES